MEAHAPPPFRCITSPPMWKRDLINPERDKLVRDKSSDILHWSLAGPEVFAPVNGIICGLVIVRSNVQHCTPPKTDRVSCARDGVGAGGFRNGKLQSNLVPRLESLKNEITSAVGGLYVMAVDEAFQFAGIDPGRNADKGSVSKFVVEHHFALIGHKASHVHPRRGAVQEQIDRGDAILESSDSVPSIVNALG